MLFIVATNGLSFRGKNTKKSKWQLKKIEQFCSYSMHVAKLTFD
jgi:hypothetical protein